MCLVPAVFSEFRSHLLKDTLIFLDSFSNYLCFSNVVVKAEFCLLSVFVNLVVEKESSFSAFSCGCLALELSHDNDNVRLRDVAVIL